MAAGRRAPPARRPEAAGVSRAGDRTPLRSLLDPRRPGSGAPGGQRGRQSRHLAFVLPPGERVLQPLDPAAIQHPGDLQRSRAARTSSARRTASSTTTPISPRTSATRTSSEAGRSRSPSRDSSSSRSQLVRVQVRFVGEDNRPLRPNRVSLVRLDQLGARRRPLVDDSRKSSEPPSSGIRTGERREIHRCGTLFLPFPGQSSTGFFSGSPVLQPPRENLMKTVG